MHGRLLIVDDEVAQMQALCNTLQAEGYQTTGFSSAREALASLTADSYDLLLTDLMMPEMDGIALLDSARQIDIDIAGIVMTGHATIDTAVRAMRAGALDYIQKPFRLNVILPVISRALDLRRLRLENAALLERERQTLLDLESANKELQAANRDLESFSYSVSHDLRAPLRAIRGFTDMYLEEFGSAVAPGGRSLLDQVVRGGQRMDRLIEDLLQFCRFSRQPLVKIPINLGELVQHVAGELLAMNSGRKVDLRISELPTINGDPSLLQQVFVNLLSNAFKFTREREVAVVEVKATERDGETVISVCDNGAGFEMKFASKMFGVFQRMHSADQFEGTGVGLSIVQRIIERHGGRIWAEGIVGEGARFHFTLGE